MVGELHVELVGGPHDGAELIVPSICECGCGNDVQPGTVFAQQGVRYVLGSNRAYAFHLAELQEAQGG